MSEDLYLDTARLGRMSSGARRAVHAFTDMIGEEGGSLYSERFLRRGLSACPSPFQERYPGLTSWSGVGELKSALRGLVGTTSELPVLLAHRSAVLMRLAARLLFHPCRNVLVTDLGWPGYHDILLNVARRTGRTVTVVPLRDRVLGGRAGTDEVVEEVRRRYSSAKCDGLFFPAVSNLGVRMPLEAIVRSVEAEHEVRFVVIDGAQDFCHAGADLGSGFCDLYLSGCHKWLGAYHPLGIACYGRRRSVGVIETTLDHLTATKEIDDPLLRFSAHLESDGFEPPAETVSVVPLITCRGAVEDETRARADSPGRQRQRLDNLRATVELVHSTGWEPLPPDPALCSGILLLRAERPAVRGLTPETLRSAFQDTGVALTAYPGGYVRVSMPDCLWAEDELVRLEAAFRKNA